MQLAFSFKTGTIGVAHSLNLTGSMESSETNLSGSASIIPLRVKNITQGLKNTDLKLGLISK